MIIGNKEFDLHKKTYVMGILNATPDSFSDGGKYTDKDSIKKRALQMVEEGVDIIDIGGMSTRPGHDVISVEEEIHRVVSAIEYVREETDTPISVDTYRGEVAEESIIAGADLINDIWGLKENDKIAHVIAKSNLPCCLMHNKDKICEHASVELYLESVDSELKESLKIAKDAGISDENIILDPGIGFGKTYNQNLLLLNNLCYFTKYEYPLLLGTSRKSVIGLTLDLPVNDRLEGTLVTSILACMAGYGFVRVHDVEANKRAIKMYESIKGAM